MDLFRYMWLYKIYQKLCSFCMLPWQIGININVYSLKTKEAVTLNLLDESDRGAVIVGAALLENELDLILKQIISDHEISNKHTKEMFSLSGPLASFSSKSLICYGFGFISKDIFDDLSRIRRLRNKFAHSSEKVDFLFPGIEDHVATIHCCVEASKGFPGKMFQGRKLENQNHKPQLQDWEMRSKGFVKYTKTVFCLGIQVLIYKIKQFQLERIETVNNIVY